jgi:hypothetical protein
MPSLSPATPSRTEKPHSPGANHGRGKSTPSQTPRGHDVRDRFVRGGEGLVAGSVGAASGLIGGALLGLSLAYGHIDLPRELNGQSTGIYSAAQMQRIHLVSRSVTWGASILGAAFGAAMGASRAKNALVLSLVGPVMACATLGTGLGFFVMLGAGLCFGAGWLAQVLRAATGIEATPAAAALVIGGAAALGAAMGGVSHGAERTA